jgi:16S rRNA (cytosine1402-N4)-methyltransferase
MIHCPVLMSKVLELLEIKPDGIYVDATVGLGGHAAEILKRLKGGILVGIDLDSEALEYAKKRLTDKAFLVQGNFKDLDMILDNLGIGQADGILFDLGVSSLQLDCAKRGFSFLKEGELDMRMDLNNPLTAKSIVNTYPRTELERILREYGEERWAGRIVKEIIKRREKRPIETTLELAQIVEGAIPSPAKRKMKIHPATKTFQALRIEVNDELENLKEGLEKAYKRLKSGGVMAVISFHSLEDRIVKHFFREKAKDCVCPPELPICRCDKVVEMEPFKLIKSSLKEIEENPHARSARLRGGRKV